MFGVLFPPFLFDCIYLFTASSIAVCVFILYVLFGLMTTRCNKYNYYY